MDAWYDTSRTSQHLSSLILSSQIKKFMYQIQCIGMRWIGRQWNFLFWLKGNFILQYTIEIEFHPEQDKKKTQKSSKVFSCSLESHQDRIWSRIKHHRTRDEWKLCFILLFCSSLSSACTIVSRRLPASEKNRQRAWKVDASGERKTLHDEKSFFYSFKRWYLNRRKCECM